MSVLVEPNVEIPHLTGPCHILQREANQEHLAPEGPEGTRVLLKFSEEMGDSQGLGDMERVTYIIYT